MTQINTKATEGSDNTPEGPAHRTKGASIDLGAVRTKLQQNGPDVWRSLDEVSGTHEFKEYLHREFPSNASEWLDPVGRRELPRLGDILLARQ